MLPTSTDVTIDVKTQLPKDVEAIVVFAARGGNFSGDMSLVLGTAEFKTAERLVRLRVVKGKSREVDFDLLESPVGTVRRIYVAGLGEAKKIDAEAVRRAAGAVMKTLRKHGVARLAIVPPVVAQLHEDGGTTACVEGLLLAAFRYDEYRGAAKRDAEDENKPRAMRIAILSSPGAQRAIVAGLNRGRLLADAQNFARTIAFRPGNDVNPPVLARIAQQAAKEVGLSCRVLDEKVMRRLGMGGIVAVGAGSAATPPRLIALEWGAGNRRATRGSKGKKPARRASKRPLLLVGKAITFDTGGVSIKPAANMQAMVFDKCGAMAVLGAMVAVARLKLPIHVVGLMASAENHLSATAYRPGDILRMYNKVTVEVTNTDAEGRLVLGDALAWGIETYKPAAVVDLATLTGAMVIALGLRHCGAMGNSDPLFNELKSAGAAAGELIWQLPLDDEHRDLMKSDVADILNASGRDAGAIKGGAFLSYFVPRGDSVPWCHLDIAGVADTEKELPYYGKGATGWGVRTLVNWIESRVNA